MREKTYKAAIISSNKSAKNAAHMVSLLNAAIDAGAVKIEVEDVTPELKEAYERGKRDGKIEFLKETIPLIIEADSYLSLLFYRNRISIKWGTASAPDELEMERIIGKLRKKTEELEKLKGEK